MPRRMGLLWNPVKSIVCLLGCTVLYFLPVIHLRGFGYE